jgi:hypothetical protein
MHLTDLRVSGIGVEPTPRRRRADRLRGGRRVTTAFDACRGRRSGEPLGKGPRLEPPKSWPESCFAFGREMARLAPTILLTAAALGCAHAPRRVAEPTGHGGCYRVRIGPWVPADVPVEIARDRVPRRVALVVERDSSENAVDPGWRLAGLGVESNSAARSIYDGAWWPIENGGVEVRLGDAFSGIHLTLKPSLQGFVGKARTYQDVGELFWRAEAELGRTSCDGEPKVTDQSGGADGP